MISVQQRPNRKDGGFLKSLMREQFPSLEFPLISYYLVVIGALSSQHLCTQVISSNFMALSAS